MRLVGTKFDSVKMIEPTVFTDARGFFMESYNLARYQEHGVPYTFIQDNHSLSSEVNVLRGLHYQLNPKSQVKLVRVLTGAIFDVVVDIRKDSSTFGEWASFILSETNKNQLLVPEGFAHGFCTLEPNTQVFYKVNEYYSAKHDRGILWNDPAIGIDWPTINPILSEKDRNHPLLTVAEINFE